jgi:general secretion pathway protein L
MSTLVLSLPPRPRLGAQGPDTSGAPPPQCEYEYLLTPDGATVTDQGRCVADRLPRADVVVALPAESDLSWHQVTLPKAGRARMRAALAGLMEESLLDDTEHLHFAIGPEAGDGGAKSWVAIIHKPWLLSHLATLEAADVFVDRVAPLSWPQPASHGHFHELALADQGLPGQIGLRWSGANGVVELRVDGSLARRLFPAGNDAQWTATPAAAEAAQAWIGSGLSVVTPAQRWLAALNCPWNLRQFDLAARARGTRALRQLYRGFMHRDWRPVRIGLAGLIVVQFAGLNLWAWHQRSGMADRRQAIEQVLRSAHPQVRSILDPALQMQRETDLLRAAAGRPGMDDLESLLSAAAAAWPADRGPLDGLRFEPGRLTLSSSGWRNDQIEAFRTALRVDGWQLEVNEGRFVLSRARSINASPVDGGRS